MARCLLFLFMSISCALCSLGQSPGGVPGAELWQVTAPTSIYPDSTYYWENLSGDSVKAHLLNNSNNDYIQSRKFMQAFNFNPAFHFKAITTDSIITNLRHTNLSQATILGVFAPDSLSIAQDAEIYSVYGNDNEEFSVFKESINGVNSNLQYGIDSTLNLLADNNNDVAFKQSALRTLTYQRSFTPNHSVWGEPKESSIIFTSNNNPNYIFCPELIAYGRELSHYERRKVESYLAIKYGITLRGSLYAPDGTLIWDAQTNNTYNHRVTAIANYSDSKLFQPLSTTSYEEPTYFAIDSLCDSYYLRSSYNKPTSKRLLVMGREYGSPMPDNSFMIWGDDDSSLHLSASQSNTMWQVMERKWMLSSNLPSEIMDTIAIVSSNISIAKIKEGLYSISRGSSPSVSDITFGQNTSNDLHFGFTCPSEYTTFEVLIKPARSTSSYGFKFNSNGTVYTVDDQNSTMVCADARNHRIDIYKKGDNLLLQVDGIGGFSKTLVVPVTVQPLALNPDIVPAPGYICKGALHVYGGGSLVLNNFHVDGFCNTDNQIELNYNLANDLKLYRNRRTFMLISTDENIDPNDTRTRVIRCGEFDRNRHKTIFHNVPFEDDSTQYFTFAAYDGFDVDLNAISATCIHGVSQNNGRLNIDIKYGTPLFKYTLVPCIHNETTDNMNLQQLLNYHKSYIGQNPIHCQGWFSEMAYSLTNLSPCDYYFQLNQVGGLNIYAAPYGGSINRKVSCGSGVNKITWKVNDTKSKYRVGINGGFGNITAGINVDGSRCFAFSGDRSVLLNGDLNTGDSLSIRISRQNILLTSGDNTTSYPINSFGYVFLIAFDDDESVLADVKCLSNSNTDLNAQLNESDESIVLDSIKPMYINAIVLIADCDGESEILRELQQHNYTMPYYELPSIGDFSSNRGKLIVLPDGYRNYQAELHSKDTDSAQLLVFDAVGRLITQANMSSGEVKYASFSVPTSGVYIVKVLTSDDEYTWKLLSE